jgi:uncharacterized membrane protein YdjX (TVP38/TMEM64 family)
VSPSSDRDDTAVAASTSASAPPTATIGGVVRQLGSLSVLAIIACTLPPIGGFALLAYREPAAEWLLSHQQLGLVLYIAAFVAAAGLALLPTHITALMGGYAFRFALGFPAAMAGFVGAAALGYVVARTVAGDRALRVIAEHPRARAIHKSLLGVGYWRTLLTITLLRLPPNSPFALTNLVLAATRVPLSAYLLGTLLGMAPRTAAMIYVGAHLKDLSETGAPWWYFWAGVALTLLVLAMIGHFVNQALAGRLNEDRPKAGPPGSPEPPGSSLETA